MIKKGIILCGGLGTRLYPITISVSKQLLSIYDKPMVYYPLCTLMQLGIKDILIICTKNNITSIKDTFAYNNNFGLNIDFAIEESPKGIAQCFTIGEDFIGNDNICLILSDNLFLSDKNNVFEKDFSFDGGAKIFLCEVNDPSRYGVTEFDQNNNIKSIVEKPSNFISNWAVTGLYFYDNTVIEKAKRLTPSKRGELEITDINNMYLEENQIKYEMISKQTKWFDTGTFDSLIEASNCVMHHQKISNVICCPEEISYKNGWINRVELTEIIKKYPNNPYKKYLEMLVKKDE